MVTVSICSGELYGPIFIWPIILLICAPVPVQEYRLPSGVVKLICCPQLPELVRPVSRIIELAGKGICIFVTEGSDIGFSSPRRRADYHKSRAATSLKKPIATLPINREAESSSQGDGAGRELKFDSSLRADAGLKRMLDLGHFGDQIGRGNQFLRSVAAGKDDVNRRLAFASGFDFREHFIKGEHAVAQNVYQFVKDEHVILTAAQLLQAELPGIPCSLSILFGVLG